MKYSNYFYWNIGKKIFHLKNTCSNPNEYVSTIYSYTFGNSKLFNRENIIFMKNFYLCFPIYIERFNELSWNHFKLLLKVKNKKDRNLYLWIALFCKSSLEELEIIINHSYFSKI